jgi:hypothetical protein
MKKFTLEEEFCQCSESLIQHISQFYQSQEYELFIQISDHSFGISKRIILMQSPTLTRLLEKDQKRVILDPNKIDNTSWYLIFNYLFGKKIIIKDNFQLRKLFISSMYLQLEKLSKEILKKMELKKEFFQFDDLWYKMKLEKILNFPDADVNGILQIESFLDPKVKLEETLVKVENSPLKRKRKSSFEYDQEIEKLKMKITVDSKRIKDLEETNLDYESKIFSFHKIQKENQILHQNNQQLHNILQNEQLESQKKYNEMEKYFMEKETNLQIQLKKEEKIVSIFENIFKKICESNPTLKNLF